MNFSSQFDGNFSDAFSGICINSDARIPEYQEFARNNSEFAALLAAVNTALPVLSVGGNALVMMTIALVRELRVPANLLLFSLAANDVLTGIVIQTAHAGTIIRVLLEPHGQLCQSDFRLLLDIVGSLSITCGLTTLCLATVDRFIAITRPLRYITLVTKSKTYTAIVISSIACLALSLIRVFLTPYFPAVVTLWYLYLLCLCVIMVFLHLRLYRISRKHSIAIAAENKRFDPAVNTLSERKALKTVLIITLTLVFCFVPVSLFGILVKGIGTEEVRINLVPLFVTLLLMAPSINPFVYFIFSAKIRRRICKLAKRFFRK
ncbi:predicted protein [Nematostella vectensis]|uniref:G-protein coupled receptors family 1 profile domain-containing protein n=1 Tax=Nematostella vectensis TaxID=45351 RepID=A7RFP2_NEMVE|nr:beta-2 adrenergic receptor [Nematostella vectensis]XP_032223115.1 beta-2 adrenergic receptor [Nematostella vectensis]EDO49755.1 predicted protein [Nematostella vectensis]|eukprot:XP_001641818.1 predicted protein [Nematostella vectensis]